MTRKKQHRETEVKSPKKGIVRELSLEDLTKGPTILMIEDDPYLREYYKRLLEREGFSMVIADDGEDGLQMLKTVDCDLVILDIMLPRHTGIEILEILKREKIKHPPIIIMTDLDQSGVEQKARSLGAVDYIAKYDVNGPELKNRINKHILAAKLE